MSNAVTRSKTLGKSQEVVSEALMPRRLRKLPGTTLQMMRHIA